MKIFWSFLLVCVLLFSCKKNAGEGGNSSIKGKVNKEIRIVLSNPNTTQKTVHADEVDVYIVYGSHISPDDKIATNYNGEYEFLNLRPGKYAVYVFSRDTNSVAVNWDEDHMPIKTEIEITDKKQQQEVKTLTIYDTN